MPDIRFLETDSLTNQNIATALAIGAYTADAARKIYCRVLVNQVAGGGDYVCYLTLTKAAVVYRVIPVTTATAAAALTSIAFQSIGVLVDSGDVLTCWLTGLAGDTTTPDTRVDWYEGETVQPVTPGATLAVDTTHRALADLSSIKGTALPAESVAGRDAAALGKFLDVAAPTGTVNSLPTAAPGTVDGLPTVGDDSVLNQAVPNVTGNVDGNLGGSVAGSVLGSVSGNVGGKVLGGGSTAITGTGVQAQLPANAITAAVIATDAIDADALSADAIAEIKNGIGNNVTATVPVVVAGTVVTVERGDTLSIAFTGIGAYTGWTRLWFTAKQVIADGDTNSVIQIVLSSPGVATDGLNYLNGVAQTGAALAYGSITADNAALGNLTVALTTAASAVLAPTGTVNPLAWDVQWKTAAGAIYTLSAGTLIVTGDVTRAVA